MDKKNAVYQIELEFSAKQTLKELLTEMLLEKICTFDVIVLPD